MKTIKSILRSIRGGVHRGAALPSPHHSMVYVLILTAKPLAMICLGGQNPSQKAIDLPA
jgi:hypothetical protein